MDAHSTSDDRQFCYPGERPLVHFGGVLLQDALDGFHHLTSQGPVMERGNQHPHSAWIADLHQREESSSPLFWVFEQLHQRLDG